ncbi:MAG TPA: DinB family protein [Herpetosiphonaceae bacterium]
MTNTITTFPHTYHVQFSFHFDETQRLLELARALPDDVYRAQITYSHTSIHNTFSHLLSADLLWRNVIVGTQPSFLEAEDIAGVDALVALFEIERQSWLELIATLDDATLLSTIERQSPFGTVVLPIWQTLQHVILHGMAHHNEIARMLFDAGQSPGDIDFLFYQPAA